MAKTIVSLAMSLDGFIAGSNDGQDNPLGDGGDRLFDWYFDGDTTIPQLEQAHEQGNPGSPLLKLSKQSAAVFQEAMDTGAAIVTGRRTYDIAGAWGGNGPIPGAPVFVVTHDPPAKAPAGISSYTYTDDVASAIEQAKAAAGDKYVALMGASVPQQCLRLGLLDEIQVHVVPVLLGCAGCADPDKQVGGAGRADPDKQVGGGVRLFDHVGGKIDLELLRVVDAPGVTHLRYRVRR